MKMTAIPIVIGALGAVNKALAWDWRTLKLKKEWKTFKQHHFLDRTEY